MIILIDNYDSFTYNLVQIFGELGADIRVIRNDAHTASEIVSWRPELVIFSPGPGNPSESGVSLEVMRGLYQTTPLFGVCLGHQCMGEVFGGKVVRAPQLFHGKTSLIHHNGEGLFKGIPNPFEATRYHSLMVERETLPRELEVTAWTGDGIIMGLRHRRFPVHGVQFHPESILTRDGKALLANALELIR